MYIYICIYIYIKPLYSHYIPVFVSQRRGDGSVVTWGRCVRPPSPAPAVRRLKASSRAFAAVTLEGHVTTWGDAAWIQSMGESTRLCHRGLPLLWIILIFYGDFP